jgi:holo-[acyl-carrier-protein] synthase
MQNPRFVSRILTAAERSLGTDPTFVAGRWAAKEAIQKALPSRVGWQEIEVLKDVSGAPIVTKPHEIAVLVSIAHEDEFATATAIRLDHG